MKNELRGFNEIDWVNFSWMQDFWVLLRLDSISWLKTLEIWHNFMQWLVVNTLFQEKTVHHKQEDGSRETKIGPVLEVTTSCNYGKHGVEIRIWSLSEDNSQSWVRISHGSNKFVMDSNNNTTEIPEGQPEEQALQLDVKDVACRSKAKAKLRRREPARADSSIIFTTSDVRLIFIPSSTMDWYLEVRIQARDRQCSSCVLIQEMKVTETLNVLTSLYHNDSAASIDARLKRYKFHTEDDNYCHAVIHRLDQFGCTFACGRPRSELLDVFNDRRNCRENATDHSCDATDDDCNGVDLITVFEYVMDAGCIDSIACIDIDVDYTESSNEGDGGNSYYWGYYYGSEQALWEKLEELMKVFIPVGYKFDQISLQLKVVVKQGDQ